MATATNKVEKSEIKCATERCAGYITKYGENYHRVFNLFMEAPPAFLPDATAKCEQCGGYTNGQEWKHVCKKCGKDVEPGALFGFFVPHRCADCDRAVVAEQKAKGQICRQCGQVSAYCCC
jgi:rRNA maturation protein Nop10